MPEVLASFIGSILRHLLTGLAVYFVSHGYFTENEANNYIAAGITALLGMGWAYWQKYRTQVILKTGLESAPGTTVEQVVDKVKAGGGAALVMLLLAGLSVSACASNAHLVVSSNTALVQALHQVKLDEAAAFGAGLYSKDTHEQYLKVILQADRDALALTDGVVAWRAAGASPARVPALVTQTQKAFKQILNDLAVNPTTPLARSVSSVLAFLTSTFSINTV